MKQALRLLALAAAATLLLWAAGCKKDTPAGKAFTFQLDSDPRSWIPRGVHRPVLRHHGGGPV